MEISLANEEFVFDMDGNKTRAAYFTFEDLFIFYSYASTGRIRTGQQGKKQIGITTVKLMPSFLNKFMFKSIGTYFEYEQIYTDDFHNQIFKKKSFYIFWVN